MKLKILPAAFLFGVMSWASGQVTDGDWTYVVQDGGATITASTASGAVTIPSRLGGYMVKQVGVDYTSSIVSSIFGNKRNRSRIFEEGEVNTSVTSIIIPGTVRTIGDYAFQLCTGLTSVSIGSSVTDIGSGAFYGCTGLTSVVIPNSVTSVGGSAFKDCTGLTSVVIPNSVTSIGDYAFYGCTRLTSVVIPDSVTSIGGSAFKDCPDLQEVEIPLRFLSVLTRIFDPETVSRLMIQLQEEANPSWSKRILRIFQP